jgi:hypothetical protein
MPGDGKLPVLVQFMSNRSGSIESVSHRTPVEQPVFPLSSFPIATRGFFLVTECFFELFFKIRNITLLLIFSEMAANVLQFCRREITFSRVLSVIVRLAGMMKGECFRLLFQPRSIILPFKVVS